MTFEVQAGVVFTSLHSFGVYTNGTAPRCALVEGSDGNFYGTAGGGTNNSGVVFSIGTNGALTVLHAFTGGVDGAAPYAGLVDGSDGNFYGTTWNGGTNDLGTVFKISASGTFTSLHSFAGGAAGANPSAGLLLASDGDFYGTTSGGYPGGTNGYGTVFKISADGAFTSLYSFTGYDGAYPAAPLVQGTDGNFYGTTQYGGNTGTNVFVHPVGTVFKISPAGALTTLYTFTNGAGGANPVAPLVQGSDGNFYGTTYLGGAYGQGTVFKISPSGSLTRLYSFNTGINDGDWPQAGLTQGSDGNFYGTTWYGGAYGFGTVFKISTNGALSNLYSFTGSDDGANPFGALLQGSDGNFYGTTEGGGGMNSDGTVFKISANGSLTALYSFSESIDGGSPWAGLVQGSDGDFYGTDLYRGVFKISASGAFTNLYFFSGGDDGDQPYAPLVQGSDGSFYGTTENGGNNGHGTVFKISSSGSLTSLYSFTGGSDGSAPFAGLVRGSDGNFYGTTFGGGTNSNGTVFKISASGSLTSMYSFSGSNDGANPTAGLAQGSDGNFYGTTGGGGTNGQGTVFKISSSGLLTSLYSFTGLNDGGSPWGTLVQGSDGNFYGTTPSGGRSGSVFKISPDGVFTILHSFSGGNDGGSAYGGLALGSDGNFYGTGGGGANGQGTVFRISPGGAITNLYSFTGGVGGADPRAGLVQGSDGSFYGTTTSGGMGGNGTVFRVSVGLVANPVIQTADPNFGVRTNQFGFDITGINGSVVVVEASTDLASPLWIPLATNTLNGSTSYFSDPKWRYYGTRFYRLRTQ